MNEMSRRVLPPSDEPTEPSAARGRATPAPFGVLDIGTTKIVCIIGRVESDGSARVCSASAGRRAAACAAAASSTSRRPSARSAPRSARPRTRPALRLRAVTVNLSCGQPESRLFNVQWPVGGRAVAEHDIRRVLLEGRAPRRLARGATSSTRCRSPSPSTTPQGVSDPRGLHCETLSGAAARRRRGDDRAAHARRVPGALRPRNRRAGLRADGGGPGDAGGGRAAARRHRARHGRRHHRHGGVRRGPAAAHRATADRRRARHQRHRARAVHAGGARRAAEDAVTAARTAARTTSARCCRCRWSARKNTRSPRCRAAWW